jgi:drug/metabolite transporter (DMT)-like permease
VLWGWVFWGTVPDSLAWAGVAVIVLAGLIVIRKDRDDAATAVDACP